MIFLKEEKQLYKVLKFYYFFKQWFSKSEVMFLRNNCLQVQERSSNLMVPMKIPRNSAPMLPLNILLWILEQ